MQETPHPVHVVPCQPMTHTFWMSCTMVSNRSSEHLRIHANALDNIASSSCASCRSRAARTASTCAVVGFHVWVVRKAACKTGVTWRGATLAKHLQLCTQSRDVSILHFCVCVCANVCVCEHASTLVQYLNLERHSHTPNLIVCICGGAGAVAQACFKYLLGCMKPVCSATLTPCWWCIITPISQMHSACCRKQHAL
eukprot:1161486-Pelagomonas_calceolata.AAC.5